MTQAESQLTVPPVNPSGAIWSIVRLRLSSVIVWHQSLHPANVVGIVYVFGTIPSAWGGTIPLPAPSRPRFVVVTEDAAARPAGPWRVARTVGHLTNGKPRYDPWNFYARHLDVAGNVPKQAIRRIGLQILKHVASRS